MTLGRRPIAVTGSRRANPAVVQIADELMKLVNSLGPGLGLKYNKYYIGLQRDGVADNFIAFTPRKKHMILEARIDHSEELDSRIEDAGIGRRSHQSAKQHRRGGNCR